MFTGILKEDGLSTWKTHKHLEFLTFTFTLPDSFDLLFPCFLDYNFY